MSPIQFQGIFRLASYAVRAWGRLNCISEKLKLRILPCKYYICLYVPNYRIWRPVRFDLQSRTSVFRYIFPHGSAASIREVTSAVPAQKRGQSFHIRDGVVTTLFDFYNVDLSKVSVSLEWTPMLKVELRPVVGFSIPVYAACKLRGLYVPLILKHGILMFPRSRTL